MIKRLTPFAILAIVACGGGGDSVGPNKPSSDLSTMAVGDVRVFSPTEITNGLDLPSGSGARDYVVIVGNTNSAQDVVANYVVKADRSSDASFGIAAPNDIGLSSSVVLGNLNIARTPTQSLEMKVRAFERTGLALHSKSALPGVGRFTLRRSTSAVAAAVPAVGDVLNLKIPDGSTTNLCNNYIPTQAVVASVSAHAIIAVDTLDGPPATLFTPAALDSIALEFDNITYPTDAAYFGTPTDVDGNGRVIMLFTGQINKLTPPNSQNGFVGGFFFAGDFFPATDQGGGPNTYCPESNNAEIFYLLSPDPTGRFGNVRSTSSVRQGTRGTIAHEFQHMINAGRRFQNPAVSEFESTWLDEALAHFAEDAVGRVQRGFGDLQTLTLTDLLPSGNQAATNDFNAFFFQNLARLTYWMLRPDTSAATSKRADENLSTRGAAWSLVRYAADNFSGDAPRAFTLKLAAGPDTGTKNFTAAAKAPLDTLISGWLVADYADHLGIAGLKSKYQYKSYNLRNVMPRVAQAVTGSASATYPLQVLPIGSGSDNISSTNRSGSGTYYRLNVAAGAGAKNVKILDPSGAQAAFPGEHVYVLRVQ